MGDAGGFLDQGWVSACACQRKDVDADFVAAAGGGAAGGGLAVFAAGYG